MRSFIYDDFVQNLLKQAQQAAPVAPPVDRKAIVDAAKAMISNLESQLGSFTADKDDAALHTANLVSLDRLFLFLSENNLKKGGYPIVVKRNGVNETQYLKYTDEEKSMYSNYPDVDKNPEYHVNKDLLIEYLNELLVKNDPLLNALLKQRINDANIELTLDFVPNKSGKIGPDGKSLVIDERKDKASSYVSEQQSAEQSAAAAKQTQDLIIKISSSLPFSLDFIDFSKIQKFFDLYRELIGASTVMDAGRKGALTRCMAEADKAMNEAWTHTQSSISVFPAKGTPDDYQAIVKNDSPGISESQHFAALIDRLKAVLANTKYVVNDLYINYKNAPNRDAIMQQVIGNSIYQQNWNNLIKLQGRIGEMKRK